MKRTIDGRKYGIDGDFVIKEMNTGQWEDYTDEVSELSTSFVDGEAQVRVRPGAMRRILIKYGVTEAPIDMTDANIRNFPLELSAELSEAVEEVNDSNLPFVGMGTGKGMPGPKQETSE